MQLAKTVSWEAIEVRCGEVYSDGPGMPPLPTRLMAGLAILKHTFNLSDEELCARWVENPYFQFFCGEAVFRHDLPFDRSSMTRWRQRMGDALGTTLEFKPKDSYQPLAGIVGGGPFRLKAGAWTDDTSIALARATSLVKRGGLDERDLMERFCAWAEKGEYSHNGRCFDIGITVRGALDRFRRTGEPVAGSTDPQTAGNGSLMRLAPVCANRDWGLP